MKVIDTYNAIVGAAVAVLSYIFGEHWILFAPFPGVQCCGLDHRLDESQTDTQREFQSRMERSPEKLAYWIMIVAFGASGVRGNRKDAWC